MLPHLPEFTFATWFLFILLEKIGANWVWKNVDYYIVRVIL